MSGGNGFFLAANNASATTASNTDMLITPVSMSPFKCASLPHCQPRFQIAKMEVIPYNVGGVIQTRLFLGYLCTLWT